MALQTCNRCRKRRIKCDLGLPACRNCSLAETECFFFDESLQQEFPRSYLHALNQKLRELQGEIKTLSRIDVAPSLEDSQSLISDTHLGIDDILIPGSSSPSIIYLGAENSAVLVKRLLTDLGTRHITSNHQDSQETVSRFISLSTSSSDASGYETHLTFPLNSTYADLELSATIPPSTQQAIIEHYLKVVQPNFPVLTQDQQRSLTKHSNPLQWSTTNFSHPDANIIIAVFTISLALLARDVDPTLQAAATTSLALFHRAIQDQGLTFADEKSLEISKQNITSLCFQAIYELVNPVSGQAWDIVGRALASLEQLRLNYHVGVGGGFAELDDEFRHLELSLLILESTLAIHFRRPSPYCEIWPTPRIYSSLEIQPASTILAVNLHVLNIITQELNTTMVDQEAVVVDSPSSSAGNLDSLIPENLRLNNNNNNNNNPEITTTTNISPYSARLYLTLHPIFTSSKPILTPQTTTTTPPPPPRPPPIHSWKTIALSATVLINELSNLNTSHKIISIWRSTDEVFRAGVVLVYYLVNVRQRLDEQETSQGVYMDSVMRCTALLASFAERWQGAKVYRQLWEALLCLSWEYMR